MQTRIKELREDNALRQIDLARVTGIDQRTISNYETEKTVPDACALVKIADYFNVSVDYLLCRTTLNVSSESKRHDIISRIQSELDELKKF